MCINLLHCIIMHTYKDYPIHYMTLQHYITHAQNYLIHPHTAQSALQFMPFHSITCHYSTYFYDLLRTLRCIFMCARFAWFYNMFNLHWLYLTSHCTFHAPTSKRVKDTFPCKSAAYPASDDDARVEGDTSTCDGYGPKGWAPNI